jgi:hypothetical protein
MLDATILHEHEKSGPANIAARQSTQEAELQKTMASTALNRTMTSVMPSHTADRQGSWILSGHHTGSSPRCRQTQQLRWGRRKAHVPGMRKAARIRCLDPYRQSPGRARALRQPPTGMGAASARKGLFSGSPVSSVV